VKATPPKKSASVKSSNSSNKKETTLFLGQAETTPKEQFASKYRAGDMDMLERNAEKPLPAVFQQMDRTYRTVHSFFGLPLPIV
jgi:hypothetical protein